MEKMILSKWAFRLNESSISEGRALTIHPKCYEKSSNKSMQFFIEQMTPKVTPISSQEGPKKIQQNDQKHIGKK